MNNERMIALGLADPSRPVTAGEVMRYMHAVILAERARLASIMSDLRGEHPDVIAEAIADDDDRALRWK